MLSKFSVRLRLFLLLVITSSALLVMGLLGFAGMDFMNKEIDHVFLGGVDEVQDLVKIRDNLGWNVIMLIDKARDGTLRQEEAFERIQQARAEAIKDWNAYSQKNIYLNDEIKKQWNRKAEQVNQLIKNSDEFIAKWNDSSKQNSVDEQTMQANLNPIFATLGQIISLHVDDTNHNYKKAKEKSDQYIRLMVIGLALSLVISIFVAYAIIRSITVPLQYVVKTVDRVAEGDTTVEIISSEGGELGKLMDSVKNMISSTEKMSSVLAEFAAGDLSHQVSPRSNKDILGISLNEMSNQMRTMIGNIKGEVNVLSSSSQEILTSLSQLSSGSAESATAVTETTTTLEELKQTANVSSEKAKDVLSNAEETLVTVKASEKSVQSVIEDMNQIKDRMHIISESILKLSEKSLAIAEIMDSVNDIAEQSNLLAVNAAIEAAKAGEQGRSFSVVAQEIRTLAEQSKGATVQVRSLLNEIQNATNSAVLATEQGSKAVAKGVEQSNQTTESIKDLIGNMNRVTQSANQIVLSNQQQSVGTEQISIAMSNINEATQQHVDRLKEIETAVASLNNVSTSLKGLTDQYIIEQNEKREKISGTRIPQLLDKIQKKTTDKEWHPQPTK